MVSGEKWRDIEARNERSTRLRKRFGVDDRGDHARDWLTGVGAVPFALVVIVLIVYAVISFVIGVTR